MNQDIHFTKCEDAQGGMNFSRELFVLEVNAEDIAMKMKNVSHSNGGANQTHILLWVLIIAKFHLLVNTHSPLQPDLHTRVFCISEVY